MEGQQLRQSALPLQFGPNGPPHTGAVHGLQSMGIMQLGLAKVTASPAPTRKSFMSLLRPAQAASASVAPS